jgi:hypothetical protein
MKNNNYYAVHKNKKPKRRLQNTNWKSIYDVISKTNELVKSLLELRKATFGLSQAMPKYKQGGQASKLAIVGNNDKEEIIVDINGNKTISSINNYGFTANDLYEASKKFSESFPSIDDFKINKKKASN